MLLEMTKENTLPAGFTTRPATLADVETIIEMLNICSIAHIGRPDMTVNDMESFFNMPGLDPATNTRLTFAPDGRLVGYHDLDDTRPIPVKIHVWGRTHPDFEGLGIGSAAMAWAEERARQIVPRLPADVRVVMHSHTYNTVPQAAQLLQDQGMTLVRHYWHMAVELDKPQPDPIWPADITLTSFAEFNDLPALYRADVDAFQDHWGYVAEPEEEGIKRFQHWIESDEEFEPGLWFLAMAGDEIAGLSLCRRRSYDDEEMGWVNVLAVRRPWRKQGLGLALLQYSFQVFQERGKKRAGLGVDAGSLTGATRLYEKAGMKPIRQNDLYEKVLRDGKDLVTTTIED
ncbi:MAG: GNAT family N-acetyltransferase [Chloroflexota bacterium]